MHSHPDVWGWERVQTIANFENNDQNKKPNPEDAIHLQKFG